MITNNKIFLSAYSLFKSLLEEARKLNEELNQIKYKIISFEQETAKIKIQIIGKSQYFFASADDLISDKTIMDFSKKDIILITYLASIKDRAAKHSKSVRYKFLGLVHSLIGKRTQFKVINEWGDIEYKVCSEALFDPTLLATASDKEKISVGYIAGYEECKEKTNYLD